MPSGPGVISDDLIKEIADRMRGKIETFLLTSETTADGIYEHYKRTITDTIQLVDRIELKEYNKLRDLMPGVRLVQVVHVIDEKSVEEAVIVSSKADALLLDSGNPLSPIKILGGTGKVHDWELSRMIVENTKVPVYLAGGLNPDNVSEAVAAVNPYAVDVCSGVRTKGNLDVKKLESFISSIT